MFFTVNFNSSCPSPEINMPHYLDCYELKSTEIHSNITCEIVDAIFLEHLVQHTKHLPHVLRYLGAS